MKVGYVLKKFPRYSETFILREVLALEDLGVPVQVLSLNPPRDGRFHASLARLRHTVEYVEEGLSRKTTLSVLERLRRPDLDRDAVTRFLWEAIDRGNPALLGYLAKALRIAERVREEGITHLHAHFATSACEVARMAGGIAGVPYSFTAHAKDIFTEDVDRDGLDRKFADCRFAVTVCDANRRYLESMHPVSQGKLVRIYNGIDLNRWDGRVRPDRNGAPPRLLAVGRFVPKKGFHLLVDAVAALRAEGFPVTAQLLGDGELLEPIRDRVRELDLDDHIHLPGAASSEQVREAMLEADLLVCPSVETGNGDRDALPTVLLEAQAAGLPCVATPIGGIPEILDDGRAGVICDPEPGPIAASIRSLLERPDRLRATAESGRLRAEALFDVHRNVAVLADRFRGMSEAVLHVAGGLA